MQIGEHEPDPVDRAFNAAKLHNEIHARCIRLESPPATINIELTGRCNFKPPCTFCVGKNQNGYEEPGDISDDQLNRYWPYLVRSQRVNDCSYGEPLLYPRIEEVIMRIKANGVTFGFSTNGLLLNERRSRFLVENADTIQFSVSVNAATSETYGRLHGQDYKALIHNIEQFIQLHKEIRFEQPLSSIVFSYIIMRSNQDEVLDFLRLAAKLGVKYIVFRHLFDLHAPGYICENFGQRFIYEKEMLPYADYKHIENQIGKRTEFKDLNIAYAWNAKDAFMAQQAETDIKIPCLFPWKFLSIMPFHDIYTPCAFLKKSIALPSQTTLEEVWNGEVIVGMRSSLLAGEIPNFCHAFGDCCPLILEHRFSQSDLI